MLDTPDYRLSDPAAVRELVRRVGWATMVTATGRGEAVVSHLLVVERVEANDDPDYACPPLAALVRDALVARPDPSTATAPSPA